ncbi:MAG: DUF6029 family protein [Ignavibacteria bacterium]|nr:DUF6029 family protein [Ignavibacteria bacterium]
MKFLFFFIFFFLSIFDSISGDFLNNFQIGGNFQSDSYYYLPDSVIESAQTPEKIMSNNYLFLNASFGNFTFDLRYEAYFNPILGFDPRYSGNGLAFRGFSYKSDFIDITAGNFYEQFGSGMILRSFEERNLGIDNSFDGIKIYFKPAEGINFKALFGKQRFFWGESKSLVRGADFEIQLSTLFPKIFNDFTLIFGNSFVSRYQPDLDSRFRLPQNVLALSTRVSAELSWLSVFLEYAHKYNDPNFQNKFRYNGGSGVNINLATFTEGFSFLLNAHRYDNIEFRAEREAKGLELFLNYLPPLTKQHTYSLPAFYSPSTQGNGEIGFQTELTYTIPANTPLLGEYETNITLGFSRINSLDTTSVDEFTYSSPFPGIGKEIFYQDFFVDFHRKISKAIEIKGSLINSIYNKDVMENQGSPLYGKVKSTTIASEIYYSFDPKNTLRLELQHMWSKNDSTASSDDRRNGNWFAFLIEHSFAPHWFITFSDQWNYGNQNSKFRVHYLKLIFTYTHKSTRLSLGFGREAGGIVCIGGICRYLPISYGLNFSVMTSF